MTLLLAIAGTALIAASIGTAIGHHHATRRTADDIAQLLDEIDQLTAAHRQAVRDARRLYRCNQKLRTDVIQHLEHMWHDQ